MNDLEKLISILEELHIYYDIEYYYEHDEIVEQVINISDSINFNSNGEFIK